MPASRQPSRSPWEDRFSTPTTEQLLSQYEGPAQSLASVGLTELEKRVGQPPSLEWLGLSWKWTLVYKVPGETEPCAYLIPTPDWPSIALPVPLPIAEDILIRRGSKYLRETLVHACQVDQVRWAQWSIQGKAQLADVLKLTTGIVEGQPV
ncbi:MAG: hypothetical protein KDA31_04620 [Phycisphaerales bacterium]|nr:hypothetical protein [Phycisphaerales bacterium]MCB9835695.1 hypothetical protein [Phycisphaera sp.]